MLLALGKKVSENFKKYFFLFLFFVDKIIPISIWKSGVLSKNYEKLNSMTISMSNKSGKPQPSNSLKNFLLFQISVSFPIFFRQRKQLENYSCAVGSQKSFQNSAWYYLPFSVLSITNQFKETLGHSKNIWKDIDLYSSDRTEKKFRGRSYFR